MQNIIKIHIVLVLAVLAVETALSNQARVAGQLPDILEGISKKIRIDNIEPRTVRTGATAEISGINFDMQQGSKIVLFMRGRFRHELNTLRWSDTRIRVEIPENAVPGDYRVGICTDRSCKHGSNTRPLSIVDAPGAMFIENVVSNQSKRIVDVRGKHFGRRQGAKVVAMNHGQVNPIRVLRWSDRRVVAQIPAGLEPGEYRVLIYYDDSYRTSSNSMGIKLYNEPNRGLVFGSRPR